VFCSDEINKQNFCSDPSDQRWRDKGQSDSLHCGAIFWWGVPVSTYHFFFFFFFFFFFCCQTQFLCRTIFISLMIDEDDNSYVAMALRFGVRLTCQEHTPRIMVLTKSGNYVHLWCWSTSSIFLKSVSKHPHCRIRKWMNLGFTTSPLGPQYTHPG
jgi:hypothetical protein